MRPFVLLCLLLFVTRASAQPGSGLTVDGAGEQNSEFGWHLSPHGTIRVLVLFCEIDYDVNPKNNPAYDEAPHWPKGQLPTWKDDLFDPRPSPTPTASVTRYYHDVSMGQYVVLGDYVDRLFTLKESEYPEVKSAHSIGSTTVKEANKRMDSLRTRHGLRIEDLDLWQDGGRAGTPKVNTPDDPHRYDHVMVIARNSGLTHGQGSTDQGSPGKLWGYESDTQSRFGGMNALPFEILKHEFNHLLIGGNNFHSGGGNAAQFDSHTMSIQGGWSLMGASSSSLLTCSGWDRVRMGWFPEGAAHVINARSTSGAAINGDLDPMAGDTGLFVIRDFVTTGDALRIRMPFLPASETQQWLWVENHQTFANNGSPTDRFHWEGTGLACIDPMPPGIMMQMQFDHEIKRGPETFSGLADYLRPLTACGHYDLALTGEIQKDRCPFGGERPIFERVDANPLTGNSEQELIVYDRNGDGALERGEHYGPEVLRTPEGVSNHGHFFGRPDHVFRPGGNRVLDMTSNPSSANMLTLACNNKRERNKATGTDNRTIHLNGIRVEVIEQRADGSMVVRVATGRTRAENDVRWCADSIVLHALRGVDGHSLTLATGRRLLLDRSRTPTRMALQEEMDGYRYFAPRTTFVVVDGASMRLEAGSTLELLHGSTLHVMPGAQLVADNTARMILDGASAIVLHGNAVLKARKRDVKKLKRKGRIRSL